MYQEISVPVLRPDITLYTDIVYKNARNDWMRYNIPLRLHLMRPYERTNTPAKLPLFLWAEGGAWKSSAPASRIPELSYYAYHGYAVASVQYRTSTQSIWPAQIEDVKAAIRFLKAHAEEFGIDTNRIVIGGESAGAHLSALAALTGKSGQFDVGDWLSESSEVQGAICWYCPGDMERLTSAQSATQAAVLPGNLLINDHLKDHPEKAREMSPMTYVTPEAPPFLFFHGDQDFVVPVSGSKCLYDRLTDLGVPCDFCLVRGAAHATAEFSQETMQERMLRFMDALWERGSS